MAFKIVISDPESRKSYQIEKEAPSLIGLKIGDEFDGSILGLNGYKLKITGGTDKDGFPMHPSIEGMGRRRVLLSRPPCFHPKRKGERRRKTVRGNTISEDIAQINVKVVEKGEKSLEEILGKKKEEKKTEEAKTEEKKEEKTEEKEEGGK